MLNNLVHRDIVKIPGIVNIRVEKSNMNVKVKFFSNTSDVFIYLDAVYVAAACLVITKGLAEAAPDIEYPDIFRDPAVSQTIFPIQPGPETFNFFARPVFFKIECRSWIKVCI